MLKTLERVSKEELRSLVDFSRALVVKVQEEHDVAEAVALVRAGAGYLPEERLPRQWEQIVGYSAPGSTQPETRLDARWYRRPPGSFAALFAVDASYNLWQKHGDGSWVNVSTGQPRTQAEPSWPVIDVPAGETYVDPIGTRYLVPVLVWVDRTSGDVSALGPGSGEFIGDPMETGIFPPGLSELIPTPQEYVTARLRYATANLTPLERSGLKQAIENFETPGPWEDIRQPYFLTGPNGTAVLDENNVPVQNPLRVVEVPYRGELNDYCRRLVRDHGIDPFLTRTTEQFEIIRWSPTAGRLSGEEARRFVAAHAEGVRVFKAAFFNEALEADPLYFRYCRMFIAWMTVIRVMNERMRGALDVDRMSKYELTNLLYSFGIYNFDDMPTVYKRRFAKALERMLADKGTTAVFKDILAIFGLDKDVKIWKHYLVRYFPDNEIVLTFPREPADGEVAEAILATGEAVYSQSLAGLAAEFLTVQGVRTAVHSGLRLMLRRDTAIVTVQVSSVSIRETGAPLLAYGADAGAPTGAILEYGTVGIGAVDYGAPDVGFQKVDIDDPTAEITIASLEASQLADYDEFVSRDPTWEMSREDAEKMAFSVLQTKYFSITSAVDTVYNGMAMALLWSTLKDAQLRGRTGGMGVDSSSSLEGVTSVNLFEALVAALTLTLWRFGVDDIIPHGEGGVATIVAARTDGAPFPGEGSLLPFSTRLERVTDQPDPLEPPTVAAMIDKNIDIALRIDVAANENVRFGAPGYDSTLGGEEARTVWRGQQLERLWDHKFVQTYQTEAFGSSERYSEWLAISNPTLAEWVRRIDEEQAHVDGILAVTLLIEEAMDSETLNLPATLGMDDILMQYVERMVMFFKAYTTDLRSFSIFLLVDRPATESLRLMNLLAGIATRWDRDDDPLALDDFFALVSKLLSEEGGAGGAEGSVLVGDLLEARGRLMEQDIARMVDNIPGWVLEKLRVEPAAVMHDEAVFRCNPGFGDALTMATRFQRDGDVAKAARLNKIPAMAEYDTRRPWRARPRHGLADGAIILTPD